MLRSEALSFSCDLFVELRFMFRARHTKPIDFENRGNVHPND